MQGNWIGLREANAALRRLPEYARVGAQTEMNTSAFQVSRGMQSRVAVSSDGSHGRPAGFLRQSIQWQARPRSVSAVVGVDPAAYYWQFLEYGTVKLGARPFARPSADAVVADHDRRLIRALREAADDVERSAGSRLL